MSRLLIVRHGQSEWNAGGRWQGQADAPLSELGRKQAVEAAPAVGAVGAVVASDLDRAARTAEIIAASLRVGPVERDPRLRERHAGEWQGLTRAEIEQRYPGDLDCGRRPPGWESDDDLAARAFEALERWSRPGATVLLVSHGGVIMTIEQRLGAERERVPNLGGRYLECHDAGWTLGDRVSLLPPDHETVPRQL